MNVKKQHLLHVALFAVCLAEAPHVAAAPRPNIIVFLVGDYDKPAPIAPRNKLHVEE